MFHAPSKIRSLSVLGGLLGCLHCGHAQYSGVGVSTPVRLANAALLVGRACECLWIGYEPNRFGLSELHWTHVGGALPVAHAWWTAIEIGGRSTEGFSQVRLRWLGAQRITDFFAAGVAITGVRFAVSGLPARWWGMVDVGVSVDGGRELHGGLAVHNVLPVLGGREVAPVRLGAGVGWRGRGWAVGIDGVMADLTPPEVALSLSASLLDAVVTTIRLSGGLPQLHLHAVGEFGDIGMELVSSFHSVLGWRYAVTVLYCWR